MNINPLTAEAVEILIQRGFNARAEIVDKRGAEREAVIIREFGKNVSPILYTDRYKCTEANELADALTASYNFEMAERRNFNVEPEHLYSVENLRENIRPILAQKHHQDLATMKYLDMEVCFYIKVPDTSRPDGKEYGITRITNKQLNYINFPIKELYKMAVANLEKDCVILTMRDQLEKMRGTIPDEEIERAISIYDSAQTANYVITCRDAGYGGAILMDSRAFRKICIKEAVSKLAIIPASTHELIASTGLDIMGDKEEAEKFIAMANEILNPDEVLSGHLYYYDLDQDKVFAEYPWSDSDEELKREKAGAKLLADAFKTV